MAEIPRGGADPTINEPYLDPDFHYWQEIFERPGREIYDRRHEILQALNLKPGMWVADVGAGTGLFTRLFATRVTEKGRVFAVDISEEFISNIVQIAKDSGQTNIEGVVNSQTSLGLQPNSIDIAFVCDTYHHFEDPKAMLSSFNRSLKPGGRLIIIDYRKLRGFSSSWIMEHVRLDKMGVIKEVQQAGFRLLGEESFLRANYFLKFIKDSSKIAPYSSISDSG
ncbi:MAG: methyltransferase domain-containing protein [Candidatus Thiodiazotropha sp.]